jgi:hypothetical protein
MQQLNGCAPAGYSKARACAFLRRIRMGSAGQQVQTTIGAASRPLGWLIFAHRCLEQFDSEVKHDNSATDVRELTSRPSHRNSASWTTLWKFEALRSN